MSMLSEDAIRALADELARSGADLDQDEACLRALREAGVMAGLLDRAADGAAWRNLLAISRRIRSRRLPRRRPASLKRH